MCRNAVVIGTNKLRIKVACPCSQTGFFQEMKKENTSLLWTVALYLALSTICVTANRLCAECIELFPEMVPMESDELCEIIG